MKDWKKEREKRISVLSSYDISKSDISQGEKIINDEKACYYFDIIKQIYTTPDSTHTATLLLNVDSFIELDDMEVTRKIYQLMMDEKDGEIIDMAFSIVYNSILKLRNVISEFTDAVKTGMSKDDLYGLIELNDQIKMREFVVLKRKNIPIEKIDVILNMTNDNNIEYNSRITECGHAAELGMDLENLKRLSTLKTFREMKLYKLAYIEGFKQDVLDELYKANDKEEMKKIIKDYVLQLNKKFNIE